jgi:hypothetical protein
MGNNFKGGGGGGKQTHTEHLLHAGNTVIWEDPICPPSSEMLLFKLETPPVWKSW